MNAAATTILKRNNVTISASADGTKPPLVLLHGLGGSQGDWHLLVPQLEENYRVVLLDLVGAGWSDLAAYQPDGRHSTLDGHATDLLEVFSTLNLTNVLFVGHSVAAMIGVLAAIRAPERFAKLALISPSPRYLNETGYAGGFEHQDVRELLTAMEAGYCDWCTGFAPVLMGQQESSHLVLELTNSFISANPEIVKHFARVTFCSDIRPILPHLLTPTLIIQAARDAIAPLAIGYYLHEQLVASQLEIVDASGHYPHLSAPVQTLDLLQDFFIH